VQFDVRALEVLVLDEADRLLDLGFEQSINTILLRLPKQRRTGLFSATQTTRVRELARAGLRNPVQVDVKVQRKVGANGSSNQLTPMTLRNSYMFVPAEQKLNHLVHFLTERHTNKVIVFVLTCALVQYLDVVLPRLRAIKDKNITITSLHGKMANKKRVSQYEQFTQLSSGVLLCTDVAARGIDVPDVDWILQYDAPQDPDFFVHR
jgi:ATP-dependent RNA helicase DDX55/SPB4